MVAAVALGFTLRRWRWSLPMALYLAGIGMRAAAGDGRRADAVSGSRRRGVVAARLHSAERVGGGRRDARPYARRQRAGRSRSRWRRGMCGCLTLRDRARAALRARRERASANRGGRTGGRAASRRGRGLLAPRGCCAGCRAGGVGALTLDETARRQGLEESAAARSRPAAPPPARPDARSFMKRLQISTGRPPPVTFFVGELSSLPSQTPVTRWPV